jgi:hypothetical protein
VAHLTPHELIELWRGYLWRREEMETTLASLVTVWIANTAGKALKKRVKLEDIIGSKRRKIELNDNDRALIQELYK